jgi:hypothetical protein
MQTLAPHHLPGFAAALLAFGFTASIVQAQTPATAPATAPATTQAAADEVDPEAHRKDREAFLKQMPVVQVNSLRDVVSFALEKDELVLRTSIPPTEMAAVVVGGKPTLISVMTQAGDGGAVGAATAPANKAPYQPTIFQLERHELTPTGGIAITQMSAIAPRVSISRSSEGPHEPLRNVDFIQNDPGFLEESDNAVRFYVQVIDKDETVVDLKLGATNLAELRRRYPTETMRYLEPMFRDFGQSGVLFQINSKAAWQVLGATHTPPADLAKQVDAVLARLDADDAKVREAAAKELEQLGQPAALVLMNRDRSKLSEEQLSRVETFLSAYKPLSDEEAARMRDDPEFLLMALSSDEPELANRALDRLKEVAKQPIAFDANATGTARFDAIAKLRTQLLPATTRPATKQVLRESASDVPSAANPPPPKRDAAP